MHSHLETVIQTGKMDAAANAYLEEALASKDYRLQARAVPLLRAALEKGAITPEAAAAKMAQMKEKATGEEKAYWQQNEERFRSLKPAFL